MAFVAIWIVTARRLLELAPSHPQAPLLRERLERLQGIRERNLTALEVGAAPTA